MSRIEQDGNALTDPPAYCSWRQYKEIFGDPICGEGDAQTQEFFEDRHLTCYQFQIIQNLDWVTTYDALKARYESSLRSTERAAQNDVQKLQDKIRKLKKYRKAMRLLAELMRDDPATKSPD